MSGTVGLSDLLNLVNAVGDSSDVVSMRELARLVGYEWVEPDLKTAPSMSATPSPASRNRREFLEHEFVSKSNPGYWVRTGYKNLDQSATRLPLREAVKKFREPAPVESSESIYTNSHMHEPTFRNLWDGNREDGAYRSNLDTEKLVNQLSEARFPVRLPLLPRRVQVGGLILLLDRRRRLLTMDPEYRVLVRSANDAFGTDLHLVPMSSDPEQFLNKTNCERQFDRVLDKYVGPIVIASDFDGFESKGQGDPVGGWQSLIRYLRSHGRQVITVGTRSSVSPLAHHFNAFGELPAATDIDLVLAVLSRMDLVDANRMRAMFGALSIKHECWFALEVVLWNHDDRDADYSSLWRFKENRRAYWATIFKQLPVESRGLADEFLEQSRSEMLSSQVGTELLIEAKHGFGEGPSGEFFRKALALANTDKGQKFNAWLHTINPVIQEMPASVAEAPDLEELVNHIQLHAAANQLPLPFGLTKLNDTSEEVIYFVQRGEALMISERQEKITVGSCSNACMNVDTRKLILPGQSFLSNMLVVNAHIAEMKFERLHLPEWANCIERTTKGSVVATHENGVRFGYTEANADSEYGQWRAGSEIWPWATETGVDLHGLWADFQIKEATQRLRWIPAGSFLMGSPSTESERDDDETQHEVTLTQGYWMAETACTQELWQAVMVKNPSRFDGTQLPVERISWEDTQRFIEKLNEHLPGFDARLPTEAEWEYAARAGTQTAFWWGNELTPDRANYDGDFPYNNGPMGIDREKTVPVKEFEPNPWGLYQVDGNVWEWCSDWYGAYPQSEQTNPTGPESGVSRVLRGGSWIDSGWRLRSASRFDIPPSHRFHRYGFRLAAGLPPEVELP